jgi:Kef-type K+ transport system membrane component KefB
MIFFIPVGLYLSTHMIDDEDWSLVLFTMLLSLSVLTLNCFFGEGVLSKLDKSRNQENVFE